MLLNLKFNRMGTNSRRIHSSTSKTINTTAKTINNNPSRKTRKRATRKDLSLDYITYNFKTNKQKLRSLKIIYELFFYINCYKYKMKFVTKIVYINKMVLRRIIIIKTGYINLFFFISQPRVQIKSQKFNLFFRLILINFYFSWAIFLNFHLTTKELFKFINHQNR